MTHLHALVGDGERAAARAAAQRGHLEVRIHGLQTTLAGHKRHVDPTRVARKAVQYVGSLRGRTTLG